MTNYYYTNQFQLLAGVYPYSPKYEINKWILIWNNLSRTKYIELSIYTSAN